MSEVNSVNWFEIYVQDMARARAFYEAVLEVKLEALKPPGDEDGLEMWSFPGAMDRYGANGALCSMQGVPSGPGGTLVYFATEDCAVTAARVAKAGGRVHREKMSIGPYGFIALAFDTEGNMIGLHSMQ
ncbi:MAG TPA: VOC family protein [Luteimonas sp.]|nr:VOC family protein [Luteimonas sp.]